MKTSVKDRFSNVIAWLGFLIITTAFFCFALVAVQFVWHLVSPIADYDTELQERWVSLSRTGIYSIDELEAKSLNLDENIATKDKELSKLESHLAEGTSKSAFDSSSEEKLELLNELIASYEIKSLLADVEHMADEVFEYGESRKRYYVFRYSKKLAVRVSYFLPLWVLIVLLNYVMIGSVRLLPWHDFEE